MENNDRCPHCQSKDVIRINWSEFGYDLVCKNCGIVTSCSFNGDYRTGAKYKYKTIDEKGEKK